MKLLLPCLMVACLAMPLGAHAGAKKHENDERVSFVIGLRAIYQDACAQMRKAGAAQPVAECVDEAVEAVMEDGDKGPYASCIEQGGIIWGPVHACAEATTALAMLPDDASAEQLLRVSDTAARYCAASVLCDGEAPKPRGDT